MTVVIVSQQDFVGAATATTHTLAPTGIKAGNSLILLIGNAGGGATGTVTGVADTSGSNVWTLPSPPNGGVTGVTNTKMAVAYVHNCAAPGTITITSGSIANMKMICLEVSGLLNATHDTAAQDVTAAASLTNVAPTVTTSAPAFVIALVNRGGTADPTATTAGWTPSTASQPDLTAPILRGAWQEFFVAGASGTCTFTFAASLQAGLGTIAFLTQIHAPIVAQSTTGALNRVTRYLGSLSSTFGIFDNPAAAGGGYAPMAMQSVPRFYRGSYSAISGAADEPIPSDNTDWATVTMGKPVPFYRQPVRSPPLVAANSGAVPDTWAAIALGRSVPFYKGSATVANNVFDPATNTFADWAPPPSTSPRPPFYRGSYSYNANAADQLGLGIEYAPIALNPGRPNYTAPRSIIEAVFDQPVTTFGTDWASVTQDWRAPFRYLGAPSLVVNVFDPALNTFADWAPAPAMDGPVPWYRSPRSAVWSVFDPATNSFADWAPAPVVDGPVPFYRSPLSQVAPIAWGQSIVTDAYAPVAMDSLVPFYRSPRSLVIGAFDQTSVVSTTDWASVVQSYRSPFRYLGSASLTFNVYDPRTNSFADWAPSALLSRMVAFYRGPRGQTVLVFPVPIVIPDSPAAGGGHTFILRMRDPFSEKQGKPAQATDPFVDPFTMKKPKGVR